MALICNNISQKYITVLGTKEHNKRVLQDGFIGSVPVFTVNGWTLTIPVCEFIVSGLYYKIDAPMTFTFDAPTGASRTDCIIVKETIAPSVNPDVPQTITGVNIEIKKSLVMESNEYKILQVNILDTDTQLNILNVFPLFEASKSVSQIATEMLLAENNIETLQSDVLALQGDITTYNNRITALENAGGIDPATLQRIVDLETAKTTNDTNITTIQGDIDTLQQADINLTDRIDLVEGDAYLLTDRVKALEDANLDSRTSTLETNVATNTTKLTAIENGTSGFNVVLKSYAVRPDSATIPDGCIYINLANLPS